MVENSTQELNDPPVTQEEISENPNKTKTSCSLCSASYQTVEQQRLHIKSDWHGFNLKQKLKGLKPVSESEFEKLVEDLDESISGSELSSSEEENEKDASGNVLTTLLKKQAKLSNGDDQYGHRPKKPKRGSGKPPLMWFSSPLLPSNTSLGIYRALFTETEQVGPNTIETLRLKQLSPSPAKTSQLSPSNKGVSTSTSGPKGPHIFLCMIGGGHFAGMVVSLTPKTNKKANGIEERQAIVLAHKTFHRYTTRRKQGGSQSANDSAKGAAHSAGAGIRRYNEVALEAEIRALLAEWKDMIKSSQLIFTRASGQTNRRTLFGPYDEQVLHHHDPRNRSFPFSTRRATQAELMRAFVELTRVKVSEVDEAALTAAATAAAEQQEEAKRNEAVHKANSKATLQPKLSAEDESAVFHTTQLQALIRRSKAPAVLSYLSKNALSPSFPFYPPWSQAHHHASTPLHLAASINSPAVVLGLLTKAGADPSILNGEHRPAFDLAGERGTRDAFRVARKELGEEKWNWGAAHVPTGMTKEKAEARSERERTVVEEIEVERRAAETEKLKKAEDEENQAKNASEETTRKNKKATSGRALGAVEKTGAEKREEEGRGLSVEMRARLERERRARAAEERIRRMEGGVAGGGSGR